MIPYALIFTEGFATVFATDYLDKEIKLLDT